jgi:MFS transporter, ACS family, hexuronate transporter
MATQGSRIAMDEISANLTGNNTRRVAPEKIGRYRWKICALLFFATTLNYMDRQVLALLKPTLQDPNGGIGLTEVQFAAIVSIFSAAYAVGQLVSGNFIDKVGTRIGYAVAVTIWTVASMGHLLIGVPSITQSLHLLVVRFASLLQHVPGLGSARWALSMANLSGAVVGFGIARLVLGLGEAGNFPAAIKAVAEWFPSEERALATGIFNSGTNIGATLAPFTVGYLLYRLGWRYAFLSTSVFALIWLIIWLKFYRSPADNPNVSASELAYINTGSTPATSKVAWLGLLSHRQTWAFLLGKMMTDPIWWFYLYWLPGFLHSRFGLSITGMGLPLLVIYNVCTFGSIFGGWLPARFMSMGWSLNRARKTAMLLYAVAITPIVLIGRTHTLWQAIALLSLATAAHQAWSANLWTLASDMFPRRAVASVAGIGSCGGSLSMMFFGLFVGFILQFTRGNYAPVFLLAGSAYLVAIAVIHLLAPKLAVVAID